MANLPDKFENKDLADAIANMKEKKDNGGVTASSVSSVLDALRKGNFVVPAVWDKEPIKNEDGETVFPPETHFNMTVVSDSNKRIYLPVFSSIKMLEDWNSERMSEEELAKNQVRGLIIGYPQLQSFLNMGKGQIHGIVLNFNNEAIPFNTDYLLDKLHADGNLTAQKLYKGDRVHISDPQEECEPLKLALMEQAMKLDDIQSIYLKQRFDSEEDKSRNHWFIIVGSIAKDPHIFEVIGKAVHGKTNNKDIEFLFADSALAHKIIADSKPLFAK